MDFVKYPRTKHIEGSKFTCDPIDLKKTKLNSVEGKHLVIEEKMDGTQVGIFFESRYQSRIQSRGHYVDEIYSPEFDLLKRWVATHSSSLWDVLGDRYILFGEWLYAKHTIFYDELPDYLMEYDIFDRASNTFLSTDRRMEMLEGLSFLSSVKVLGQGRYANAYEIYELTGPSNFISTKQSRNFQESVIQKNLNLDIAMEQTDLTGMMEGLYIKHEYEGTVKERYKFTSYQFITLLFRLQDHWKQRPVIQNKLSV